MTGPERLDRFMARANAIYYATHDPFADFTTAPEISQVFGELLGLWAAISWQCLGSPKTVLLVEAGPGRGSLMADALRAIGQCAPAFQASLRVHLIETSPRLRAAQASRLQRAHFHSVRWHDSLATVPSGPIILLANEFLDALPIRQFVRRGDGWTERFVDDGRWVEQAVAAAEVPAGRVAAESEVVEVNEAARGFVAALADRLQRDGGVGLFADYGPAHSAAGDSLQALASKRPVSPLTVAGSADLTAHVDFADLALVARANGALVQGPEPQGAFLSRLGLYERTARLGESRLDQAAALLQGARRLAEPEVMGHLFKVMALRSGNCLPLPGLLTDSDPITGEGA